MIDTRSRSTGRRGPAAGRGRPLINTKRSRRAAHPFRQARTAHRNRQKGRARRRTSRSVALGGIVLGFPSRKRADAQDDRSTGSAGPQIEAGPTACADRHRQDRRAAALLGGIVLGFPSRKRADAQDDRSTGSAGPQIEAGPTACADRHRQDRRAAALHLAASSWASRPASGPTPRTTAAPAAPGRRSKPGRQLAQIDTGRTDEPQRCTWRHRLGLPVPQAGRRPRRPQHRQRRAADRSRADSLRRSTPAGPPRPRPASRSQPSAPGPQEAGDRPARAAPAAQGRTGRRPRPGRQLAQIDTGRTA